MWEWSRHQADRAAAGSFTAWRIRDPEPTVTDPEFDETEDECGEADDGAYSDVSERALAELFIALASLTDTASAGR